MVFNTYSHSVSWGFWMMQRYMMCILWLNCPTTPTQIHMLRSWFPVPQNVTAFGDKVLKEVIKLKMRFLRVNPTPIWLVSLFFLKKRKFQCGHVCTEERPYEDTTKRKWYISQGERMQNETNHANILILGF